MKHRLCNGEEIEYVGNKAELSQILHSHVHGWVPVGEIEEWLSFEDVKIEPLSDHNLTDGLYNKRFTRGDDTFDLRGNYWSVESFQPLIDWF